MPDKPSLEFVRQPFAEQVAFLRQKLNLPTERYTDLVREHHNAAFVVAGVTRAALLDDLRRAVYGAIAQGNTFAQFQREFDAIIAKGGWDPESADWRAGVIYDTNLRSSYQAGRYRQMKEVEEERPYWLYRHSGALNPREQHKAWDGLVLRADDAWWDQHYPPNGWGCGCTAYSVTRDEAIRRGYEVTEDAPETTYGEWIDPVTGEVVLVPDGVDPVWAYAPGATTDAERPQVAARALGRIAEPFRSQAVALLERRGLGHYLPESPPKSWQSVVATEAERARWLAETAADERMVVGAKPGTSDGIELGTRRELLARFRDTYDASEDEPLTFEEYAALRFYTISGEADILNSNLRGDWKRVRGLFDDIGVKATRRHQQSALREARLVASALGKLPGYDGVVSRKIKSAKDSPFETLLKARYRTSGVRVSDLGFASTAIGENPYKGNWVLFYEAKSGRRVQRYAYFGADEDEVLLRARCDVRHRAGGVRCEAERIPSLLGRIGTMSKPLSPRFARAKAEHLRAVDAGELVEMPVSYALAGLPSGITAEQYLNQMGMYDPATGYDGEQGRYLTSEERAARQISG